MDHDDDAEARVTMPIASQFEVVIVVSVYVSPVSHWRGTWWGWWKDAGFLQQHSLRTFVPGGEAKSFTSSWRSKGLLKDLKVHEFYKGRQSWIFIPEDAINWIRSITVKAVSFLEEIQPVYLAKHPSGIVPTLQNIVSTVNLDCKLGLRAIALKARNAAYIPKHFAAVIMRIREPKTTALIFASGKMLHHLTCIIHSPA
ncbi:hypothetical protein C5167_026708 [Papaver somniferum]|nr:hypothetical protein C5167_026708 [Papaver somniferum]